MTILDRPIDVTPLTAREREILVFEAIPYRYRGYKEGDIRSRWGISTTQYFQALNQVIDKPAAMAYDPILVKALQARRAKGKQRRTSMPVSS